MIAGSSGCYVPGTARDHEQQGTRESRLSSWHWVAATSLPHPRGYQGRPDRTGSRRPHHAHHGHRLLPHAALTPQGLHPCDVVPGCRQGCRQLTYTSCRSGVCQDPVRHLPGPWATLPGSGLGTTRTTGIAWTQAAWRESELAYACCESTVSTPVWCRGAGRDNSIGGDRFRLWWSNQGKRAEGCGCDLVNPVAANQ